MSSTEITLALPDLLTLSGLTTALYLVMGTIHSAELLPSRRYLPLVAEGVGIGLALTASLLTGAMGAADAVLLGFVAGALSSGIEETKQGIKQAVGRAETAEKPVVMVDGYAGTNEDLDALYGDLTGPPPPGIGGEGEMPGSAGEPPRD